VPFSNFFVVKNKSVFLPVQYLYHPFAFAEKQKNFSGQWVSVHIGLD
jgi:hypothetical protein